MYLHLQSTPFPITFRGFNRLGYWTKSRTRLYWRFTVVCESCNHKLHEVYFELNDIEKTLFLILNTLSHWRWELVKCGTVMETDPRFVAKEYKCKLCFNYLELFLSVISMFIASYRAIKIWDATPSGLWN
jgi:hypothetical protein